LKNIILSFCILSLANILCGQSNIDTSPYELVNPFIGTGGHGHTYPGATTPFGMVQLSPDSRLEGWDGCSGYHYTDSIIYGFSHTHLSGTGVGDYGDILLMPTQGQVSFDNGYKSGDLAGYGSPFLKDSEVAMPGYYQVHLDENNINVQLTTTTRVGIHQYNFENTGDAKVLIDLSHRDMVLDSEISKTNNREVSGFRISKAWAEKQHVYFVAQFSEDIISTEMDDSKTKMSLNFGELSEKKLLVKVGVSAVSVEGARKNLEVEANHWAFDQYRNDAKNTWEKALSKIEVNDIDNDKKSIFYSALYHTMIVPNTFSDVDGKYRGMDLQIHEGGEETMYTVFSLWDTFRAAHPLYTIIEQDRTNAFIRTFLKQYQQGGELPIWELAGNYTGCMIGYHAVPVIADAYLKGLRDYNTNLALEAMVHSSKQDKLGLSALKAKGFIAAGDEAESVSKTLEYAYDDWCIAEMAKSMEENNIYEEYILRAQNYKNIFNPEVGFAQGKMNGGWTYNFNPAEVNFNFTEANSWQYSMFAPQDISGMIKQYGGVQKFEDKLDELFATEMELNGRHQVDITGLIGQYAHGNEPSHHMAYLYNYIGKPWKTQEKISQILNEQYQNLPDGLSGNEDCGQMSAWYVLSSMGFYSVTPGMDYYAIGTPHFDSAKINLENGKTFEIKSKNLSDENIYIQGASLNGKDFNQSYIKHKDITNGGELTFIMGPSPNKSWGAKNHPVSKIDENKTSCAVPYFKTSSQTFTDEMLVEIKSPEENTLIFYSINDENYQLYTKAISIDYDAKITAFAKSNKSNSYEINSFYKKIKGGRSIVLNSEYSNQYSAGGNYGLIDFLEGSSNFRTGYWQGYFGMDFSAVVDLGEIETVKHISLGTLQDIKSWIWFPSVVKISVSKNGKDFHLLDKIENDFSTNEYGAFLKKFSTTLEVPIEIRYVKVEAQNFGQCPSWHLGDGNDTWLFLDEIIIE
jgi:predicted alpha-1,2-mannosidase